MSSVTSKSSNGARGVPWNAARSETIYGCTLSEADLTSFTSLILEIGVVEDCQANYCFH